MTNLCKCGHESGQHTDFTFTGVGECQMPGCKCKKFEPQEVFPHEPKKTFGDYNQETGDAKCKEMGIEPQEDKIPENIKEELDKLKVFKGVLNEN